MKYFRLTVLLGGYLLARGNVVLAAPSDLQEPTGTPTPTPTPTGTPTPLFPGLMSPPIDGGVVANVGYQVFHGPDEAFGVLGGLPYGAVVYPDARTQDGQWVRIDYGGFEGWIRRVPVVWGFNYTTLPIIQIDLTVIPGPSPTVLTLTPGQATPTAEATLTPSVSASATITATSEPTATPEPSLAVEPTSTESVAVGSAVQPTVQLSANDEARPAPSSDGGTKVVQIGIVLVAVLGALFSIRYLILQRRAGRYWRDGFVIEKCPVCKTGHLTIENFGSGRHVVRCDNCRSVLRQVRGGHWRYAVDPEPDADFADRYNRQVLNEQELVDLADERLGPG